MTSERCGYRKSINNNRSVYVVCNDMSCDECASYFADAHYLYLSQFREVYYAVTDKDGARKFSYWAKNTGELHWVCALLNGSFIIVGGKSSLKRKDKFIKIDIEDYISSRNLIKSWVSNKAHGTKIGRSTKFITNDVRRCVAEIRKVRENMARTIDAGLPSTLNIIEWIGILNENNWRCAYCGGSYDEMDHAIPVSIGGGTCAGNVVPSCFSCNRDKRDSIDLRSMAIAMQSKR